MGPTIALLDGTAALFRAHYGSPAKTNAEGHGISALSGLRLWVLRVKKQLRPDYLAVVFDGGGETFRHELHPEYKANRPDHPEDLEWQLERAPDVCRAFGWPSFVVPGYEADDLLATLARRARSARLRTLVVSPDKDILPLMGDGIEVLDSKSLEPITEEDVADRYSVSPDQIPDFLALAGDSSDGVPGIPGIGPKTAAILLAAAGTLEEVLKHPELLRDVPVRGAHKLPEKIRAGEKLARLSRQLVQLDDQVVLGHEELTLGDLKPSDPSEAGLQYLREVGLGG